MVLPPNDVESRLQPGTERAKTEAALRRGVGQPVQRDSVANPGLYQNCGVVHQVIGSHDIQLVKVAAKPAGKIIPGRMLWNDLPGADEGNVHQVLFFDLILAGERAVLTHHTPIYLSDLQCGCYLYYSGRFPFCQ